MLRLRVVVASLVIAFAVGVLPGSPLIQLSNACPPDNAPSTPGPELAPAPSPSPTPKPKPSSARPERPLPRAFQPDAASSNPRTFGRQRGHIYVGDPVDVVTGAYSFATTDLFIPSRGLDFKFIRTYNSADDYWPSSMGPGWVHSYDWEYTAQNNNPNQGTLHRGDGRRGVQPDDISWTANPDTTFTLVTHDHVTYVFGQKWDRDTVCFGSFIQVVTAIKSPAGDQMNLT